MGTLVKWLFRALFIIMAVVTLAACGGSSGGGSEGSPPISQGQESVSQGPTSPPESAIQILQEDGFPPAVLAIPLPTGAVDMAGSPLDIDNEDKPQELVVVFSSPSVASAAATSERQRLADGGYTAVTVSIKDDGYAIVVRGSSSDFLKLGL